MFCRFLGFSISGPGATPHSHGGALRCVHARRQDLPACAPAPSSNPPCLAAAPSLFPGPAAWIGLLGLRALLFVWWGPLSLQPPSTLL